MGQKVNYNKNKFSKLKIVGIVILILFIIFILVKSIKNVKDSLPKPDNQGDKALIYQSMDKYKTLGDLIESFDCRFIRNETIDEIEKIYLSFDVGLYSDNKSNETHFLNISKAVAEFLKYKNFDLIDENKDINIEVKCEEPNIVEFKINGDVNYYLNQSSEMNRYLETNITNFTIQSPELQDIIDGDWDESRIDWGTKESTCDGYNIYFDEGIKYKVVARSVFNIIFTSKYKGEVAGTLTTTSNRGEVENALGEPTFKYGSQLYGYLGKDNYLFFDFTNEEISVYPVVKTNSDDDKKLKELISDMNESSDVRRFVTDLTSYWIDYDVYEFDSNYVDLKYTLKGLEVSISSNSLKNGIFIYQNYSEDRDISDIDNVYIKDTDFVFEEEKNRCDQEGLNRLDLGQYTDEYYKQYLGVDFTIRFDSSKDDGYDYYKGIKFYSRDKAYPDSELDRTLEVSSYMWYDESKIIYSVNDDGLYIYDCVSRTGQKLIDIEGEIEINSINNNQIVYNENETINISFD